MYVVARIVGFVSTVRPTAVRPPAVAIEAREA
jgi:hypothetical protein